MVQLVENTILQRVQSSMVHIMFLHQKLRKLHRGVEQKGCYEPEVVGNAKETEFSRYRRADAHMNSKKLWQHAEDLHKHQSQTKFKHRVGEVDMDSHP